jgi:hypothetical protein
MANIVINSTPAQEVVVQQTGAAVTEIDAAPTATEVTASTVGEQGGTADVAELEQNKASHAEVYEMAAALTDGLVAANTRLAWTPSDNNLLGANWPPILINTGLALPAGYYFQNKVKIPANVAITNVHTWITTVGSGLTYAAMAVYEADGTRSGITGDLISAWQTGVGFKTHALATPIPAQPFPRTVYVSRAQAGTTMSAHAILNSLTGINVNLSGGDLNAAYIIGASPLPASLTLASSVSYATVWTGVS